MSFFTIKNKFFECKMKKNFFSVLGITQKFPQKRGFSGDGKKMGVFYFLKSDLKRLFIFFFVVPFFSLVVAFSVSTVVVVVVVI